MHCALVLTFALLIGGFSSGAHADIIGQASVIDGDTIEIHGHRIRLFGIDSPERDQLCLANGKQWRCGQQAALALHDKVAGRTVSCVERELDRYGRTVAVCGTGDENINAWLVAEGWAMAYRQYSTDYVGEEGAAHSAQKGIWRGTFVAPWDWRRGKRLDTAAKKTADCRIKGNISAKGERIYHMPGEQYYDATQVNPSKGERWFCSEAEARAAGWRRSSR